MRSRLGSVVLLGLLFCRFVAAGGAPASVVAPPGGGQGALAVGFDAAGTLRARVCASEPCSLDGATALDVPVEAARLVAAARLRVVHVGLGRNAVLVEIPDAPGARTWVTIAAAPLQGDAVVVPFSGYTGAIDGVEGERSGPALLVRDEGVYVGVSREDRDLCGRPALLSPRVLDPATLTLLPAKLQRLPEPERAAAPRLVATPVAGPLPPPLLRAVWATSAAEGFPVSALTDGKDETSWAESRSGVGRGEAVVTRAPREVPITAFELSLPGPAALAAAPRELWLATDHELFHVALPDEPASRGGRFAVTLTTPVQTSCVALVLDGAVSDRRDADVGVAELAARPKLGGTIQELVQRISGGGPEADAAAAILRAGGRDSFIGVAAAFEGLPEEGRRVALDVLDDAPCDVALPAYVAALAGPFEAQRTHSRAVLSRCGAAGPSAILHAMQALPSARLVLADELVTAAPADAIDAIVPLLAAAHEKERRAYRVEIGRAAQSSEGREALAQALSRPDLPRLVALDLLRAAGPSLSALGEPGSHAFARLATDDAPFRTRFLLLGPAANLAATDGAARTFLRHALTLDARPYVRAEAARVLRAPGPFYAELSRAADDPDVRVREAAALSLGAARIDDASPRLAHRLAYDDWPLVRSAAARSLAALGPNGAADTALRKSIDEDESADVRRAAILSVGARHVTAAAAVLRERFQDRVETDAVRGAAALSLGMLCDVASLDALTEQAGRLVSPTADETEHHVAESALSALGLLHPADLARRIAPLSAKTAPGAIRRLANVALSAKGQCPGAPVAAAAPGGSR